MPFYLGTCGDGMWEGALCGWSSHSDQLSLQAPEGLPVACLLGHGKWWGEQWPQEEEHFSPSRFSGLVLAEGMRDEEWPP